jgi:hypothetical protein
MPEIQAESRAAGHAAATPAILGFVRSPWLAALPLVVAVTIAGAGWSPAAGATGTALLASTGPTLTVVPSSGLAPNQKVVATITGEPPEAMLLVLECVAAAVSIGEDGCENRQNEVVFADAAGTATATLDVVSPISTALGTEDCVPSACFVAAARLSAGNSVSIVGAIGIGFSSAKSAGPTGTGPPAPPAWVSPPVPRHRTAVRAGDPAELALVAGRAGNLSASGAITGPSVTLPADPVPHRAVSGVALLQLVLAAPGTSWSKEKRTAVVVDVSIAKEPTQQIVCFAGSRAFTYAAVFGTLSTGTHRVTIAIDTSLSTAGAGPKVTVIAARLSVVSASNPSYLAMRYAPVVFGRPDTASSDTPLLTYAQVTRAPGAPAGSRHIEYTTIWSKEDAGTSFVPFLEWGEWGRMADITQTVALDVTPEGKILDATYNSCGCQPPFPENRTSPLEQTMPFEGKADGTHLMVLNASGNDYQSDTGTSAFRLEQAPVPGPAAGAARETVMDANPWTYRITAEELSRWYSDGSTDATSPEIGDSRQYAIVDVASTTAGVSAVAVSIRLAGSDVWYSNDLGSGYPLYTGGHGRTAVKLPLGWESRRITGLRLVAYPASRTGPWSVRDVHVSVIGLTSRFSIERPVLPHPVVTASTS